MHLATAKNGIMIALPGWRALSLSLLHISLHYTRADTNTTNTVARGDGDVPEQQDVRN